jgi:hypothetical protein
MVLCVAVPSSPLVVDDGLNGMMGHDSVHSGDDFVAKTLENSPGRSSTPSSVSTAIRAKQGRYMWRFPVGDRSTHARHHRDERLTSEASNEMRATKDPQWWQNNPPLIGETRFVRT